MSSLEGFRRKWFELRDESRRELDERQRLLRLLAVRDAFVALMVLSVLQVVGQLDSVRGLVPLRLSGLAPLYAVTLAMFVMLVSLRLRGGGSPSRVAAYRTVAAVGSVILGLVIGWLINFLLVSAGVVRQLDPDSLVGYALGLVIVVPIVLFLVRQKRPPEN